jgi:LysR family glycine cleavage system transcriptional activator
MRRLPPLSALRAFEAAARLRSFKLAAQELAVAPTAVSHQIRGLEAQIGVRLFERRTRQVGLTPAGEGLYPVLREGFDRFARAIDALALSAARPSVTITATTAFTAKWLIPRVARFQAANPSLDLRLLASDDVVPLAPAPSTSPFAMGAGFTPDS